MAGTASDAADDAAGALPGRRRLRGEDRRAALVRATALLLAEGGIEAVTMETIAVRAEVSRPLVYKHFANRDELLAEVYRQEAAKLDEAIVSAVVQAKGFEAKIRALIRSMLEAVTTHGPIFNPIVRVGERDAGFRHEQRDRENRTVKIFTRLAMTEYDVDKAEATAAISMLLTGIESIRAQWRARPTPERRQFLEDLFVEVVTGGIRSLADRRTSPPTRG